MDGNLHNIPLVPMHGIVVFPGANVTFDITDSSSIQAIQKATDEGTQVVLAAQRDPLKEDVLGAEDLFEMGVIANIKQMMYTSQKTIRVLVEGVHRAFVRAIDASGECIIAEIELAHSVEVDLSDNNERVKIEAAIRITSELFQKYMEVSPKLSPEVVIGMVLNRNPGELADYIMRTLPIDYERRQEVLEELDVLTRLNKVNQILLNETEVIKFENDMEEKFHIHMSETQKDYYIREHIKVLQSELSENIGDAESELYEYAEKIEKAKLPEQVEEKLLKELKKLEKQPDSSAESAVIRNYLDICLALPWNKTTKEKLNLDHARKTLDAEHYGMEKVKERILEFIAVRALAADLKGQIICLSGPPGVGKTSIAMSLAKTLNRNIARVSLGGIHDEAEIRGHRRTYVGSMPGQIIKAVERAGSKNAIILLDEIDKLGADYKGDPASALLEVLDPEQNVGFRDNFIELPFDLSDILFITTANDTSDIPRPLLDRMELIELSSYTDEEKLQIAKRHLLPKELKRHGIDGRKFRISDDALRVIISGYTMESGVRKLKQQLAKMCRKAAVKIVSDETIKRITIKDEDVAEYLGVRQYHTDNQDKKSKVGVVNGLAWTSVGGEMLEVEVNVLEGSGKIELTGNIGKVMQESCHIAVSYVRSVCDKYSIEPDFYKTKDIHVHFPEGAVPKDGPSAGVTITTAIVSALTNKPVRYDIAMTGEVTLRGRVLAIGGLREKTMAALRYGIKTVIIPSENKRNLEEIDPLVREKLNFIAAEDVSTFIENALQTD